ncbi:MAG: c-type cytochrome [Gammaproteobacteria bacterium]|nr:c-type cytochrome [Gammaproteobacteria bacterium]
MMALLAAAAAYAQGKNPGTSGKVDYSKMTPPELVKQVPLGHLKDPYNDKQTDIVAQGHQLFLNNGCNGCHGGGGGGGMCPPLINDVWVYGGDDDTLFRLVTLGSDGLQKLGYARVGMESVVGPMPAHGQIVKSADDLWKIITWVRSAYHGDPKYKYGGPVDENPNLLRLLHKN